METLVETVQDPVSQAPNGALAEAEIDPEAEVTAVTEVAVAPEPEEAAPQVAEPVDGKRKLDTDEATDLADQPEAKRVTMEEVCIRYRARRTVAPSFAKAAAHLALRARRVRPWRVRCSLRLRRISSSLTPSQRPRK